MEKMTKLDMAREEMLSDHNNAPFKEILGFYDGHGKVGSWR